MIWKTNLIEFSGGGTPGFTLAEVLITLGIIGIVASITLTTLINDMQDRQLTAMWKKKYSEISNIYNIVKEEIGEDFCIDNKSGKKGPNVVGRDVFAVMLNEDWAKPLGADGTFNTSANGKTCECSKNYGLESAQGFLGSSNLLDGRMLSGTCCSAVKLQK